MNAELENYYLKQVEPFQGCLLALKHMIMSVNDQITHERKYQIPFFCYHGKRLAFLWMKQKKLIIGFVTDKRVLSPMLGIRPKDQFEIIEIDPHADLPKKMIATKLLEQTAIQRIVFFAKVRLFGSLTAIRSQLVVFTNIGFIHKI